MKTDTDTRATAWSVTLFNGERDTALPEGWRLEGQMEVAPDTGRPHYQGLLHTPQVRFSSVKKVYPKAHIEKCRDVAALKKYVHKAESRMKPPLRAAAMNFTKFFEDVLEYAYDQTDRQDVASIHQLMVEVKTDGQGYWLQHIVADMIEHGGAWDYAAKATDPKIKAMWTRFRVAFLTSWLTEKEAAENGISTVNIPVTDADDNPSLEQDAVRPVGEVDLDSQASEDDQGTDDSSSSSEQGSDSGSDEDC